MKLLLWLLLLHQCRLTRQQRLLRALLQALRQSIAVNCRPALCATYPSACNYKWMYMHALKHWGWQAYCDAVEVSFFGSVVYVVEGKCMAIMDGLTQKKKKESICQCNIINLCDCLSQPRSSSCITTDHCDYLSQLWSSSLIITDYCDCLSQPLALLVRTVSLSSTLPESLSR